MRSVVGHDTPFVAVRDLQRLRQFSGFFSSVSHVLCTESPFKSGPTISATLAACKITNALIPHAFILPMSLVVDYFVGHVDSESRATIFNSVVTHQSHTGGNYGSPTNYAT